MIDERRIPGREDRLVETGRIEHFFEGILFARRPLVLVFFAIATAILAWQASQLRPDASFEKMIPVAHPYIETYLDVGPTFWAPGYGLGAALGVSLWGGLDVQVRYDAAREMRLHAFVFSAGFTFPSSPYL